MNTEEALYWKGYIDKVVADKLATMDSSDAKALEISRFADSYMKLISGQQFLPQGVFREFLRLFGTIPDQQEKLNERIAWLEENLPFEECTDEEIYDMFDLWDGYISLSSMVVDNNGWINVDSLELDDDDFVKAKENNIENDYLTR